jgi:hypothetical protein
LEGGIDTESHEMELHMSVVDQNLMMMEVNTSTTTTSMIDSA